jgi:TPP-dependent pyruvate/acetoin dehydrogenase alpha subunit
MSDPGTSYRNRDEIMQYRKVRDPIVMLKNIAKEFNLATEEELNVGLVIIR